MRALATRIVRLSQGEWGSQCYRVPSVTCVNPSLKPEDRFWLIKAEIDYWTTGLTETLRRLERSSKKGVGDKVRAVKSTVSPTWEPASTWRCQCRHQRCPTSPCSVLDWGIPGRGIDSPGCKGDAGKAKCLVFHMVGGGLYLLPRFVVGSF